MKNTFLINRLRVLIVLMFISGGLQNCNCGSDLDIFDTNTKTPTVDLQGLVQHDIVLDTILPDSYFSFYIQDIDSRDPEFHLYKLSTGEFIGCVGSRSLPALSVLPIETELTNLNAPVISETETVSLNDDDEIEIRQTYYVSDNDDSHHCPVPFDDSYANVIGTATYTFSELVSQDEITVGNYKLRFKKESAPAYEPTLPSDDDGHFLTLGWADVALFSYDDNEHSAADSTLLIVPYNEKDVIGCVEFPALSIGGYRMDELALPVTDANHEDVNIDALDEAADYQVLFVDRDSGGCSTPDNLSYKVFDKTGVVTKEDLTANTITFMKKRIEVQFYLGS